MKGPRFKHILLTISISVTVFLFVVQPSNYSRETSRNSTKNVHLRNPPPESYFMFSDENFSLEKTTSKLEEEEDEKERRSKDAPRSVVLWTSWRSGSTFMGELLANALPNTFYSIEPLHWSNVKIHHDDNNKTSEVQTFLQDLLHCRIHSGYQDQFTYLTKQQFYMQANTYLSNDCKRKKTCTNTTFIAEKCQAANIHVAKVIRLSLKWAMSLLQDDDLDLQIIYLARDPRAVLSSRSKVGWCGDKTCIDPKTVCNLLEEDMKTAETLAQKFPKKFKFVQYERIGQDSETAIRDLMSFIGLPVSQKQLQLLHPKSTSPDAPYSISKDSKSQLDRWRIKNKYSNVLKIQSNCSKPLSILGLRVFGSEAEFKNLSLPLVVSDLVLH